MKAIRTFTSKDHFHSKREVFPSLPVPAAARLSVSENYNDGFMGFGVAITPSSCYELSLMEQGERDAFLRKIYSKEGLGLSVARVCIGSSDYSPEIYSYDDTPFDTELSDFSVKRDERYVIPMIKEILKINPDLYIFASPWSPPFWMKTGGKMCGGYMRDKYLEVYADYIVKFIESYAEYGIKISALTPQNETNTQQAGRMPACVWHPETEAKFIVMLKDALKKAALDVKVWMYDHNFEDVDRVVWSLENCEGLMESCDGVAFHYYGGTVEQTAEVKRKFPQIPLHFTEGGPRLTDHYDSDFCKWGLMAVKALKCGYSSFTGWNLILDELGGPNVGPFIGICGGLVTRDSESGEITFSGQYKAFSHISGFITPESKIHSIILDKSFNQRICAYPENTREIEGVIIENPDGKIFAVIVNPNDRAIQTQLEIGGELFYLELYADSISTVEITK